MSEAICGVSGPDVAALIRAALAKAAKEEGGLADHLRGRSTGDGGRRNPPFCLRREVGGLR